MTETNHTLALRGCAPVPLAHYLKALGILRLVSEQADPHAVGWWENDCFWLISTLDESELIRFFTDKYQPTPLVVPWSGSDFFNANSSPDKEAFRSRWPEGASKPRPTGESIIEAFLTCDAPRLAPYQEILRSTFRAMNDAGVKKKDDLDATKGKKKPLFLSALRNNLPDEMVRWIDTAAIVFDLENKKLGLNCLLGGGGGSDGNANFSDNFMQSLWLVFKEFDWQRSRIPNAIGGPFCPKKAITASLFGRQAEGVLIKTLSPALFNSQAIGGANSSAGFSADAASNPWDYILMFEGSLLFAGAASRRYGIDHIKSTAFPFTVEVSPVGAGDLIRSEKGPMARETWLPLWKQPMTAGEASHLFSEARIAVGRRTAKNGVDIARAIAGYGIDRGIKEFQRIALLRGRIGGDNYFTACDAGRFSVHGNPTVEELLASLDGWLSRFRRKADDDNAPARAGRALRQLDASILELCQQRSDHCANEVQSLLIALGEAEAVVAISKRLREGEKGSGITPLPLLSPNWLFHAIDDSAEFRLAAALASITHETVGPIRRHLESIDKKSWKSQWPKWAKEANDPAIVWGSGSLVRNLNAVLARRLVEVLQEGKEKGKSELLMPLGGRCFASLGDIAAFIDGDTDDERIEALFRGLMLLDWRGVTSEHRHRLHGSRYPAPHAAYALLKLCHLPHALDETAIKLAPQITRRAIAGDGAEATRLAARRLLASGFPPAVRIAACEPDRARRIAAALMFPISSSSVEHLKRSVLRRDLLSQEKQEEDQEALAVHTE